MAAPSAPNVYIGGNHKWGSDGVAAITTTPSESVTKVTAIISQTSGGAAIETVETSTKTSSDQFADRWALSWPTTGITSSPYYVRVRSTNADGNGPFKEIAPYIYFPPTVAVTAPVNGSTLTSASVTVAWTASDPYGISAQRVTVLHGSSVLLDESVSESATSYAVPSSVAFLDGESYTFRVTARNGNGMEASADSTCAFSFDAPAAASVTITDDGATATIAVDDPHYSESGATIAVDGSAIADSFTVFGTSVQDGTPTPSAPVAIESIGEQNLLDTFISDLTTAGVTWTSDAEGMIHANGTKSGGAYAALRSNMNLVLQAGTYTLNAKLVSGTATNAPTFYLLDSSSTSIASVSANVAGSVITSTFTLTETKTAMVLRAALWTDGAVYTDATYQLWLGRGSSLSGYQPYGRVVPTTVGKNLVDSSLNYPFTFAGITYTNGSDGSVILNGTKSGGAYGVFKNGLSLYLDAGTYTFSAVRTGGTAGSVPTVYLLDGSGTTVFYASPNAVGTVASQTLTLAEPKRIYSVRFGLWTDGAVFTDATYRIQLERGSTATEYIPAQGSAYPIDLQGNALRSLPDGTRDELRVGERKVLVKRCEETLQAVTDGVTGTVGVDVLSSTGQIANGVQVVYKLAAPQEIDLGAATDYPFIPEGGEMWVDGTTMEAVLRPADYAGQPPISSVDIARVNPDGTWTLAQGVAEGQSAIDPLPPLGVPYRYALTSHAAGGGMKVAYAEHTVETRAWHLNFGDAAQEHVSYLYNPQATMTLAQGGESYHFADGGAGRGLPVFYPTTDRDMSGTLRFDTVLYGDSDILLDLCDRYPVAWLRDPFGHRWRAHVRPSVSHGVGQAWPVTIAWDAVRFEEV